jgi:hypothetical protein
MIAGSRLVPLIRTWLDPNDRDLPADRARGMASTAGVMPLKEPCRAGAGNLSALVAGSCRCVTRPSQKRLGTVREAYKRSAAQSPTGQGTLGALACRLPFIGRQAGGHAAVATRPPYSELGMAEHRK